MKNFLVLILFVISLLAKININTATMEELHSLKGIGHTKAVAIMEYRKKHPFKKIEDIMKVKGIGVKTFEKIKNDIEVKGNN
ncbi:ComEA family DNA-binding protein [Nautilia sp.]